MSKTHTITVAGRTLPVIEKSLAADLGFQPLTTPISIYHEEEILDSITASLAAAPHIQWAVSLTDCRSHLYATVWRTGMITCREIEQALCLNSRAPRVIPHHAAA